MDRYVCRGRCGLCADLRDKAGSADGCPQSTRTSHVGWADTKRLVSSWRPNLVSVSSGDSQACPSESFADQFKVSLYRPKPGQFELENYLGALPLAVIGPCHWLSLS